MKYLGIYIKDRKMYFFLTAFICGVTAVINYLYSAPPQAGLYAFKISLTVLVVVCAADYVHFYKKHENLQRHCHLKEVHALEEDAAHTAIERDYQQLVLKLIQEKAQLAEHMQKKQTDMMDYYAIWAHQIKTPIAAVDLLLQVMEENPQEVAEQDIKELKSDTVLVIEDNGIGIQSEDLPRIMERGYTGYNGRGASKSSGIGLYLCKKAADQLGIDIEVESEPYHGTKVLLTIRQHHTRHE